MSCFSVYPSRRKIKNKIFLRRHAPPRVNALFRFCFGFAFVSFCNSSVLIHYTCLPFTSLRLFYCTTFTVLDMRTLTVATLTFHVKQRKQPLVRAYHSSFKVVTDIVTPLASTSLTCLICRNLYVTVDVLAVS